MEELRQNIPENTTGLIWKYKKIEYQTHPLGHNGPTWDFDVYIGMKLSVQGILDSNISSYHIYNDSNDMMPSSNILSHQIDTRGFQWELNVVRWKYYVDVWFQGLHCWQSFLQYQIFLTYICTQVLCLFEGLHFIIVSHMGASHFGDVKQAFFQSHDEND